MPNNNTDTERKSQDSTMDKISVACLAGGLFAAAVGTVLGGPLGGSVGMSTFLGCGSGVAASLQTSLKK